MLYKVRADFLPDALYNCATLYKPKGIFKDKATDKWKRCKFSL